MLQARLKVIGGKHDGQVIPLTAQKFLIGRESDCHLRTNSDLISRHHCAFSVDDYAVRLRDLGSTNGTFVNGERVQGQAVLNSGDRVKIGRLEFELEVPVEAPVGANGIEPDVPEVLPAASKDAGEDGSDTAYELPVEQGTPEMDTAVGYYSDDTAVIPAPSEQPQHEAGQQGYYPQYYPQYPQQGYYPPPPGYYPQYGAPYQQPPGGYPQMPGYFPQGYPQQGYPQQPEQQQPQQQKQQQSGDSRNRGGNVPIPETRLPPPESTGAQAAPPKPAAGAGENKGEAEKTPSERAAEIIKQRMQRRLQG